MEKNIRHFRTEDALMAHRDQLERVTLDEITGWTTLTKEEVWKDLNRLCEEGKLFVQENYMNADMEMRLLYIP